MANWTTRQTPQYGVYSTLPDLNLAVGALRGRQEQYDAGALAISQQLSASKTVQLARDIDQQYLDSRIAQTEELLTSKEGLDYSNKDTLLKVNDQIAHIVDDRVKTAITSTASIGNTLSAIDVAKKDGSWAIQNETLAKEQIARYQASTDPNESYAGGYTNFVDIREKMDDALENADKYLARVRKVTTPTGYYFVTENNETVAPERIRELLQGVVFSSPDIQQQAGIDSWYMYRGTHPEALETFTKRFTDNKVKSLASQKAYLDSLAGEGGSGYSAAAIAERKAAIDNQISSYTRTPPSLTSIYMDGLLDSYVGTYSGVLRYEKGVKINPLMEEMHGIKGREIKNKSIDNSYRDVPPPRATVARVSSIPDIKSYADLEVETRNAKEEILDVALADMVKSDIDLLSKSGTNFTEQDFERKYGFSPKEYTNATNTTGGTDGMYPNLLAHWKRMSLMLDIGQDRDRYEQGDNITGTDLISTQQDYKKRVKEAFKRDFMDAVRDDLITDKQFKIMFGLNKKKPSEYTAVEEEAAFNTAQAGVDSLFSTTSNTQERVLTAMKEYAYAYDVFDSFNRADNNQIEDGIKTAYNDFIKSKTNEVSDLDGHLTPVKFPVLFKKVVDVNTGEEIPYYYLPTRGDEYKTFEQLFDGKSFEELDPFHQRVALQLTSSALIGGGTNFLGASSRDARSSMVAMYNYRQSVFGGENVDEYLSDFSTKEYKAGADLTSSIKASESIGSSDIILDGNPVKYNMYTTLNKAMAIGSSTSTTNPYTTSSVGREDVLSFRDEESYKVARDTKIQEAYPHALANYSVTYYHPGSGEKASFDRRIFQNLASYFNTAQEKVLLEDIKTITISPSVTTPTEVTLSTTLQGEEGKKEDVSITASVADIERQVGTRIDLIGKEPIYDAVKNFKQVHTVTVHPERITPTKQGEARLREYYISQLKLNKTNYAMQYGEEAAQEKINLQTSALNMLLDNPVSVRYIPTSVTGKGGNIVSYYKRYYVGGNEVYSVDTETDYIKYDYQDYLYTPERIISELGEVILRGDTAISASIIEAFKPTH